MRNKIVVIASVLLFTGLFFVSCNNDDDSEQIPTNAVTTLKQYSDIETANTEINSLAQNIFSTESGMTNRSSKNQIADCVTISSETNDQITSIIIDFGDGCELDDGELVSGRIEMSFNAETSTTNAITITYKLIDFTFDNIKVTGESTIAFTIGNETQNMKFETNSNFAFSWTDQDLSATSQTNLVREVFTENTDAADSPITSSTYSLTTGNSRTKFSNNDLYTSEITTPLRDEVGCAYTVSGVIKTSQNSDSITLDYGNGECDNVATQTDSDGNEITIEL